MAADNGSPSILLQQAGRGPFAPSLSPFPLKLETYFRMAKLEYKNSHERKSSKKGKIPFIEFEGQEVNDSSLIIEFINDKYKIDLNSHLTPSERGIARAFQKMAEENLYWCVALHRWVYDNKDWMRDVVGVPKLFVWIVGRKIKSEADGQGIGRHSYDEMIRIEEADIKAMSDFLDDKQFFFGDKPCETDCALFGQLSQLRWQLPGTKAEYFVNEKYTNLRDYCDRMKTTFWPDWDDCITHGGKVKKPKS
ncbi:hypothetical protein SNE40_006262 [Patella caerulea]|uniref:Uncharacterized protein n=1 Tax=Patella caerulea TaxID=87958 RepID=A0AAN8K989_PATCE